jgi:hypothetical protein
VIENKDSSSFGERQGDKEIVLTDSILRLVYEALSSAAVGEKLLVNQFIAILL